MKNKLLMNFTYFLIQKYHQTSILSFINVLENGGGIPTGITQNISDLLKSDTAKTMLANSQFITLLNQAYTDRIKLSEILGIGENQLKYVKDAQEGAGLIISGGNIIPFADKFPKDNVFYKIITTKIDEIDVSD